ncbi:MAG: hypothetical protein ABSA39_22560 [Edaphobacter sp.]
MTIARKLIFPSERREVSKLRVTPESPPTRQLLVGKTAPRTSGADDAASVLFSNSGGIMLSGVAELSVFSIQMEIRPKRKVATRLLV